MELSKELIDEAAKRLEGVSKKTQLQLSKRLSEKYGAKVYFKREDLQEVRSFKIRGAYNKMAALTKAEKKRGVVCASAGNHAQGVAYGCTALQIKGVIFMPEITPPQKVEKVKKFGDGQVEVRLIGVTFDDAYEAAREYCDEYGAIFVHPFNDELVMAGQGTVGKEIWDDLEGEVDVVLATIGGGGLISGVSTYLKAQDPKVEIYGVEPNGAPAMYAALEAGEVTTLPKIDAFVDGAAVKTVGDKTHAVVKKNVKDVVLVPEGKACQTMVELYQDQGIVTEPAGALPVAALDALASKIKGKIVVCIISGGNNDILRYPEILERSLIWQGKKHYFIINFAQKPGQLRNLLEKVLGPNDDIVRFEYVKKTNAEQGPAFVGVELQSKDDYKPLLERMSKHEIDYEVVKPDSALYRYLV